MILLKDYNEVFNKVKNIYMLLFNENISDISSVLFENKEITYQELFIYIKVIEKYFNIQFNEEDFLNNNLYTIKEISELTSNKLNKHNNLN